MTKRMKPARAIPRKTRSIKRARLRRWEDRAPAGRDAVPVPLQTQLSPTRCMLPRAPCERRGGEMVPEILANHAIRWAASAAATPPAGVATEAPNEQKENFRLAVVQSIMAHSTCGACVARSAT